jgi:hypothetical protein
MLNLGSRYIRMINIPGPVYLLNNPYLTKENELSIIKHFSEKASK